METLAFTEILSQEIVFPKMSNLCFCNKKYGEFLLGKNLSLGSFLWLGGLVYIWINYVVVNLRIMAKKTNKTNWHKRNKSVWQRCKKVHITKNKDCFAVIVLHLWNIVEVETTYIHHHLIYKINLMGSFLGDNRNKKSSCTSYLVVASGGRWRNRKRKRKNCTISCSLTLLSSVVLQ